MYDSFVSESEAMEMEWRLGRPSGTGLIMDVTWNQYLRYYYWFHATVISLNI